MACTRRVRLDPPYYNFTFLPGPSTPLRRAGGVAQLVEQLIRNQQVVGSSPTAGSGFFSGLRTFDFRSDSA
jgi:hypothetical protein